MPRMKKGERKVKVHDSTGNVFEDLGLPDPDVLLAKAEIARVIEDAIESFSGNIALAAAALELSPSTIYRKRQAWADMAGKKGAA